MKDDVRFIIKMVGASRSKNVKEEKEIDILSKSTIINGKEYVFYGVSEKPDRKGNRKEILPCVFKRIHNFHHGCALAEMYDNNGDVKFGFIDMKGNIVVPFVYDAGFSDEIKGYHKVGQIGFDKKIYYGYTNNSNQEVVACNYSFEMATEVLAQHLRVEVSDLKRLAQ